MQVFCRFWVENVHGATAACNFLTWYREKLSRTPQFFNILTYTCASRHSGVQFFPIATSKMAPRMRCFVHFDLQMCFAPQRCAIFPDRNFQNGSENEVFCTFWLTNVLRATAVCDFSRSKLPKWLRRWGLLYILTYKCASRHSGVQFFPIATSKMAPRMRCFVHFDLQMCFAPQRCAIFPDRNFQNGSGAEVFCTFWLTNVLRATAACNFSKLLAAKASAPAALPRLLFEQQEARILEKTQRFATFLTFLAHLTVTWLDCSRDMTWLWHSLWQLSILSEVRLLNFLRPVPLFYSQSFKTVQTAPFLRAQPPPCSPPSPWPVPQLRDPGIGWHRCLRETRTSNNTLQNTTWLPRLKLAQWEKDGFSPQTKQQKQGGSPQKNKQGLFFQWFFVALAAKVLSFHLLVCKQWIDESMEKPAFLKLIRKWCEEVWPLPRWKHFASGVYPVSDLYIVFICDVYLMRIQLHCTVTAEVALCQLCQLGSDYISHL